MDVPESGGKEMFFLPRHGWISCGNFPFPQVFGIINLTPDSFSDGGRFSGTESALRTACAFLDSGAFAIDAGGESTRPGSEEITIEEEKKRVIPFIRALRKERPEAVISVDTRKAAVAAEAVEAGADIINDVSGMRFDPDMGKVMAESSAGVILMHSRGTPQNMKEERFLRYGNVTEEVGDFLNSAAERAEAYGVKKESILLDPGLGFAKTPAQDLQLCREAAILREKVFRPLFYAPSRKSFLKELCSETVPEKRDGATLGILAILKLAKIEFVRVHDVGNAVTFLKTFSAALKN